ncbi:hypothetical protein Btru_067059 [Bulinus truncatus]|nr:hypothetical protein Btru_067059 [Bulinus truncatus]
MADENLNSEFGKLPPTQEAVQGGLNLLASITDEILPVITLVNYVVVSGIIGVFGLIFNIINIVIFARLGFKDTSNILFLGLSLANAGVVLMLLCCSVVYNPLLLRVFHYVEVADAVGYITFGWAYTLFTRISSGMTATITVERFICVAMPLKVKTFITKKITTATTVVVFIFPVAVTFPVFVASGLGHVYNPALNKTILGLVRSPNAGELEDFGVLVNIFMRLFQYWTVSVFTITLTRTFLRKTKWRNSATTSTATLNNRDKRLVKTVITLSAFFIILSTPGVILSFMMIFIPEFKVTGRYKNLFITLFSTFFPIAGLNSTLTLFIFLDMSSKYRHELRELLALIPWSNRRSSNTIKQSDVADAVGYITFGWAYTLFTRISSGMTATITVERFICVAMPLKVKTFITKKITTATTVVVFIFPVAVTFPVFVASGLGHVYNPALNKTILGLVRSPNAGELEDFGVLVNIFMRLFQYWTVSVFTITLTRTFLRKTKWRNSATTSTATLNNRDKRLVKTVITLSAFFIILSTPGVILSFMMIFIPEFKVTGRYKNLFITLFSTFFPIAGLNSTLTLFIFLDMSSKYRHELRELLALIPWSNRRSSNTIKQSGT